jgi:hypothetical protein
VRSDSEPEAAGDGPSPLRQVAWLTVSGVLILIAVTLAVTDIFIPRNSAVVIAEVVTAESTATKSGVRFYTWARLEDGTLVRARNQTGTSTAEGMRVELSEWTGWLTGVRRYHVQRVH